MQLSQQTYQIYTFCEERLTCDFDSENCGKNGLSLSVPSTYRRVACTSQPAVKTLHLLQAMQTVVVLLPAATSACTYTAVFHKLNSYRNYYIIHSVPYWQSAA